MKILIAGSEAVPYVKTGGLADVTGALLKEFRKKNMRASLILPLYPAVRNSFPLYKTDISVRIRLGDITETGAVWQSDRTRNPECYFIDCDRFFGRDELYGTAEGDYSDNSQRFIFFSRAVIETCIAMNKAPDIIHCNDWQTALIPMYLKTLYKKERKLIKTAAIYTIHNLGYEGLFPASDLRYTGLGSDFFTPERLEFYGRLNFMKAGLIYADLLNTVSETYANEILDKEYGFGLEGVLKTRQKDLYGVLNGVDYNQWDPEKDQLIPSKYSAKGISGKAVCKAALLRKTGLKNRKLPLIGIVSRLSWQKGIELVYKSLPELISMGFNMAILGKGDDHYQGLLAGAAEDYKGRIYVKIGFEESLAHQIYAGSDFFMMPSRYEPCGLGQIIAMKYGSLPIARKTGGLADTIYDYDHMSAKGTGFLFSDFTPQALQNAAKRAVCTFTDKNRLNNIILKSMQTDFSWKKSAGKYAKLYKKAMEKVRV